MWNWKCPAKSRPRNSFLRLPFVPLVVNGFAIDPSVAGPDENWKFLGVPSVQILNPQILSRLVKLRGVPSPSASQQPEAELLTA
jgi:hypothetical protein